MSVRRASARRPQHVSCIALAVGDIPGVSVPLDITIASIISLFQLRACIDVRRVNRRIKIVRRANHTAKARSDRVALLCPSHGCPCANAKQCVA
eukprot:CAMPEP_0181222344 /NCGR_PEP_ID=MMETSP1096-20121128/29911_1 /TAXON_ID=156174 ORGANISM="Chrysochromulina ericina, Strain CCMP281" /NCGR_SAMPLE_ID=MMETSP1096 /ASSEMBLY_ACC=CAM_ASM_000453 /LENGTH=93 /DNA_ID=CAMNT_0023315089 /DNA_START=604 /DNA_END=885 /DNA_ORIENTATION=-